ncbi:MAG: alginate export family protein, partial [Planctomycetota bacterium]
MKRWGMLACLLALLLLIPAGEGLKAQSGGGPSGWDAFNNLDVGGELRIRPEYRSPFSYSGAPDSDDRSLMRTRLHIGFDVSDHVAAMLEFQDSRAFGEEPLTVNSNANELDLHQGYVRFHKLQDTRYMRYMPEGSDAWIVFGRERLPQFGEGRMISTLEWDNVGRRYDGGRFGYAYRDDHQIDVLFANLGENALGASPGGSTVDDKLYGFNFNSSALPAVDVDLYFWWREFDRTTKFDDRTYGVRLEGDFDEMEMEMLEGAYASFELAFQNGDRGLGPTLDVSAIGWALDLGYELSDTRFSPGIGVGY